MIKQRLEDFGLTTDEINARLSKLSDAQVHEMATNLDALIPGGDGLGIIIALLVIAILVVILIYLLGHKSRSQSSFEHGSRCLLRNLACRNLGAGMCESHA